VKLRLPRFPERVGWRDHLVGGALACAYVGWLLETASAIGVPRDEGVYFRAAVDYVGWWRMLLERGRDALAQGAIDSAWGINHEHPVLMKTLFGVSWWVLHEKWHVFHDASTAWRFPAMCTAGAALWMTYLFGARAWGRVAGFVAAALLGLVPQLFFHAHLACFDVPITAMWLACVYVHWRGTQARGALATAAWALTAGVVFGLTLETKHNAWMLPAVLVPHALFVFARSWVRGPEGRRHVVWPFGLLAMATIGPAVFYALWPYIWNDTRARLEWYANFHLNHEYYNIEFLGKNYFGPPSPPTYLPLLVVASVPTVTLLLFFVGAFDRLAAGGGRLAGWLGARLGRRGAAGAGGDPADASETDLLVGLAIAVAIGPFFLPKTPIFGGTKHWMTAYPFLALLAGRGFAIVQASLRRALPRLGGARLAFADAGLVASVVLAPLAVTAHAGSFGLSAYVPLVGGTAGGADLGLNRGFWGYTTQDAAAEYLNANAPRGASVFISDTTWDAWARMQEEGRIRPDLRAAGGPGDAQYALVQHELHMNEVDYSIWEAYKTTAPAYVVTHDGVPIVSIYKRP
jgi:4-amino-4-deoxy-L-arabinose transferase-like glycosyltransferase